MDRIGDIYRSLPRRADFIVTTVGARHKCQQDKAQFNEKCSPRSLNQQENNETDFSKKLRTPVATRFHSNANSGLQMGSTKEQVSGIPAPPKSLKSSAENGGKSVEIGHGEQ
ncbi:hypothetical protein F511_36552 [Dorcoceras hygrometricum]|uniref:Uncharacterized protein n=1 Tax=Dorcoceras hygrometricum TaxID=472368 RepID=A0A2Z7B448_9LAMI|nr:hypothetical protein F511_36552 [Dorcoceras hygrometricum]